MNASNSPWLTLARDLAAARGQVVELTSLGLAMAHHAQVSSPYARSRLTTRQRQLSYSVAELLVEWETLALREHAATRPNRRDGR